MKANFLFYITVFIQLQLSAQSTKCDTLTVYNNGYVDSNWVYHNKQLNLAFKLPKDFYITQSDFSINNGLSSLQIGGNYNLVDKIFTQNRTATINKYGLINNLEYFSFLDLSKEKDYIVVTEKIVNNKKSRTHTTNQNSFYYTFYVAKAKNGTIEIKVDSLLNDQKKLDEGFGFKSNSDTVQSELIQIGNSYFNTYTITHYYDLANIYDLTAVKSVGCFDLFILATYYKPEQRSLVLEALNGLTFKEKMLSK
jgi:hypothetical protein